MSQYLIHQALTQKVIDLALGIPLSHENDDFDPEAQNSLFADLTLLTGDTESMGKAPLDSDDNIGIYQISLYEVSGNSVKSILQTADTVMNAFKFGTEMTKGAVTVQVTNASRNGGRNVDGWYVIDISITYSAYVARV
jgi:hypothetical protein